jgi:hypothetical protein
VTAVGNVLLMVAGVLLVVVVADAAVRTFVVPRGTIVFLTAAVFRSFRRVFDVIGSPKRGYEWLDRVWAVYAPTTLLALPVVFLILVFFGYTFIFVGLEQHGWTEAFETSGSSLFTLGFVHPTDLPSVFLAFTEAAIGLGLLALVIAYLPTIYGSFSRREVAVTDLSIRAGTPPTALEWLTRAHLTGFLDDMDKFWDAWLMWFTEVQETHTSNGALVYFRSPNPHRNWITAAGAVMDTAAIRLAALDMPWTPNAPLCIRSGFVALREIAGFYGFEYDPDPAPDDPISVARAEFDELCDTLAARGVPMKADRDQAWRDFAGWRVNYDGVMLALAAMVRAPYAPWISDRSPSRPLHRYPWGRRRRATARLAGPRPQAM